LPTFRADGDTIASLREFFLFWIADPEQSRHGGPVGRA
jgi:hypothetical protein